MHTVAVHTTYARGHIALQQLGKETVAEFRKIEIRALPAFQKEVMLVLMRELPVFQRQRTGSFRSFLRNVTVNQLRIALRKHRHERTALDAQIVQQIEQLADPLSPAAKQWDEEHDRAVMQRIMDVVKPTVNEKTWQAFERYALDDIPPSQVAAELGMSLNSVLLAKSRVLRRMRDEAKGLVDD